MELPWTLEYCISSNKRPGAYFLHGSQSPAVKRDWHSFEARRSFRIAYFESKMDLRHSLIEARLRSFWTLPTGDHRSRQRWPSFALRNTYFEEVGLFASIWRSERQLFHERQAAFSWQIHRSTNCKSLDANFAVKFRMQAVCEASPLRTSVFIWNLALIS